MKPQNLLPLAVGIFMGVVYCAIYVGAVINTKEFNPFKQWARGTQIREEYKLERIKYNELWNELFSKNGYADRDNSGGINFDERVEAWQRMGFENEVLMEGEEFPNPTLNDLEKAIKSYKAERD